VRAAEAFQCPSTAFEADAWSDELIAACDAAGVRTIVTAYLPQGPVRDLFDGARAALDEHGIDVVMLSRRYDREAWPYANRGYFKLKKRIASIVDSLQLDSVALPEDLAAVRERQPDLLRSSG
jgi:hypothetical protein